MMFGSEVWITGVRRDESTFLRESFRYLWIVGKSDMPFLLFVVNGNGVVNSGLNSTKGSIQSCWTLAKLCCSIFALRDRLILQLKISGEGGPFFYEPELGAQLVLIGLVYIDFRPNPAFNPISMANIGTFAVRLIKKKIDEQVH